MILEAKRSIVEIGNKLMFENMTVSLRTELVKQYNAVLSSIQAKGGLQAFVVICDDSNNTQVDLDSNQMNVQIRLLPTLAVEFIALDFIVSPSGVQFV
jgi:phage tail sheath protein FI